MGCLQIAILEDSLDLLRGSYNLTGLHGREQVAFIIVSPRSVGRDCKKKFYPVPGAAVIDASFDSDLAACR
jgi:hypothetical protein